MQAQIVRNEAQETLTAQQSLQSVQTLLRAGLGCITYLRNLLPADNFSESYLTSGGPDSRSSSVNGSISSESGKRNVSGFKIMTVTRGFTEEADKLLEYMEHGVFDALHKQYLRSFIFAIYLDNQDPNNIVEAYTFNFQYYNVPGTDVTVPIMSLGEDLMKMSISGSKKVNDPVADATKKGRIPTLGEVKRSLKALVKNLIQATTQMDPLPRRRFATFKLFYHDHTPSDYEPPQFRPGDAVKDKWFFSTHGRQEAPEKCSIGTVQTGWHGVDLRVASIAGYLPSSEDNNAPFSGISSGNGVNALPLTPAEEAATRLQQMEQQKQDAVERNVVWDAEDGLGDVDAEGEPEDDSEALATWRMRPTGSLEFVGPIGMRDEDGNIVPLLENNAKDPASSAEAQFWGAKEKIPTHIGQLVQSAGSAECTQTQQMDGTQGRRPLDAPGSPLSSPPPSSSPTPTPQPAPRRAATRAKGRTIITQTEESLPPSDPPVSSQFSIPDVTMEDESIDTQALQAAIASGEILPGGGDAEMLDMNTQLPSLPETQSASIIQTAPEVQDIVECECGVTVEDCDCIWCDGGCKKWFHVWCMGYHSGTAKNVPQKFICFDCRVRADQNWDLIMVHDLHPQMMARFRDLALFRRAIKVCENHNPPTLMAFSKQLGGETIVAGRLFKRLEVEGFIELEVTEKDDLGLMETNSRASKNKKGKKAAASKRKTAQKQRYVFVREIVKTKVYQDYFDPSPDVEKQILKLAELKPKKKSRKRPSVETAARETEVTPEESMPMDVNAEQAGSQTQAETQPMLETQEEDSEDPTGELKRKTTALSDEMARKFKKIKVSIGPAVDLGD